MTLYENIMDELKLLVKAELHDAEDVTFAKTQEDILDCRQRAFGAVQLALRLVGGQGRNHIRTWWNHDMYIQFNALHDNMELREEWARVKELPFNNGFNNFKEFVDAQEFYNTQQF